jgi:hypothetical protein
MKSLLMLFILFMLAFFRSSAIESLITIKGRIVNLETKEPLPFASVSIKNRSGGTISNENGVFEFHIDQENYNDTLLVSMLGFQKNLTPINTILSNKSEIIIALQSTSVNLKEVIVSSLTAEMILNNVKKSYKNNFNVNPFLTSTFYRNMVKEDEEFKFLIEASLMGYDKGFNVKKDNWEMPTYSVNQIRSSINESKVPINLNDQGLKQLNMLIHLRVLQMSSHYAFSIEPDLYENENRYYVLSFYGNHNFREISGKFVINSNNWGIREITYNEISQDKNKTIEQTSGDSLRQKFISEYFIVQYNEYKGKIYLKHLKNLYHSEFFNSKDRSSINLEVTNELTVNDIQTENVAKLKVNKLNLNEGLYLQSNKYAYNPDFWKNYNIIAQTPELIKLRNDLEKKGNLESQFKHVKVSKK